MKFWIAHHDLPTLRSCEPPAGSRLVHLPSLALPRCYLDNRYAESRLLLYTALHPETLPDAGPLALFHASYNHKFVGLPTLAELPNYLAPLYQYGDCYTPVLCDNVWAQAARVHPGMDLALERVFLAARLPLSIRDAPMCNTLVMDVEFWRRLLPLWLKCFILAADELENVAFLNYCKSGMEAAYLLERMTTGIISTFTDVTCYSIGGPNGEGYFPL